MRVSGTLYRLTNGISAQTAWPSLKLSRGAGSVAAQMSDPSACYPIKFFLLLGNDDAVKHQIVQKVFDPELQCLLDPFTAGHVKKYNTAELLMSEG